MSEEQLNAFLEKVKGDTSLQEKLKATADAQAVVAIAKEAGFSISADDFTKAQSEIEDAQLENAAGGWKNTGCGGWMPMFSDDYFLTSMGDFLKIICGC